MRLKTHDNGYALWASACDTENWATRPGASWPCSTLRGRRFVVVVDPNGPCDFTIGGRPGTGWIDGHELEAIVSDLTRRTAAAEFWPLWGQQEDPS